LVLSIAILFVSIVNNPVLCTVAVLLKDELDEVLRYGRQQLQFYIKLVITTSVTGATINNILVLIVAIGKLVNLKNLIKSLISGFQ